MGEEIDGRVRMCYAGLAKLSCWTWMFGQILECGGKKETGEVTILFR